MVHALSQTCILQPGSITIIKAFVVFLGVRSWFVVTRVFNFTFVVVVVVDEACFVDASAAVVAVVRAVRGRLVGAR